jgi:hypothetical protein
MLLDTTTTHENEKEDVETQLVATDFSLNNEFTIFWNLTNVWYIKYCIDNKRYIQRRLDYCIDDISMKILDVRVGSTSKIIAIILELNPY